MFPPAFDAVTLIGQDIAHAALEWAAALRGTSVSLVEESNAGCYSGKLSQG